MPVGELDTSGRFAAEPRAAALQAGAKGKSAFAGMHDAHELRYRRHTAASDAGAQRCRYETGPSPVAASGSATGGGRRSPGAPGSAPGT